MIKRLKEILNSYSNLLFIKNSTVGLLLLMSTMLNINIALQGLISLMISILFASFIGIKKDDPVYKLFTYNALLTGFAIGFLFKVTPISVLLTLGMSIFTVLLTYTLSSVLWTYMKLPVLNIPFTISATIIYLASGKYSNLIVDSFYKQENFNLEFIPAFIQGLLRAVGILIFMPYDIIGIVVLLAILFYSRITFFIAVMSYYSGIFFLSLLKGSVPLAFAEISSFNFILVGIALGGMFLIPSKRTYLLSLSGVLASVFIIDAVSVFWVSFGIPVFTLPFNLTVLLYIYVLGSINYVMMNRTLLERPEVSLINHLNYKNRFDWVTPSLNLPFMGKWTVYQGFDGEWTHKGIWKYAYDFVIEENGKTFQNSGTAKEDYFCFGKPVISPVDGTVAGVFDDLEDNEPEQVDKINNWGNYIIIYTYAGYYVELSHLKKGSVKVKTGDRIMKGAPLAECGNSGYSPQPHLHLQVQYLPYIGSAGAEFKFNSFKSRDVLDTELLSKGDHVIPLPLSKTLSRKFQFILDETFNYGLTINEKSSSHEITVKMDVDGTYYFDDAKGNKLYFGNDRDRFVFFKYDGAAFSILKYFFIALPSLPLTDEVDLKWTEYIPENILSFSSFPIIIKSFKHDLNDITVKYIKSDKNTVKGEINCNGRIMGRTEVVLCDKKGLSMINVNYNGTKIKIGKI